MYVHNGQEITAKGVANHSAFKGEWNYFYSGGALYAKGNFINGNENIIHPNSGLPLKGREGTWIFYFRNGAIKSKAQFQDGMYAGESQGWYPDGNIRYQFQYRDGKLNGIYKLWDKSGRLIIDGTTENGHPGKKWDVTADSLSNKHVISASEPAAPPLPAEFSVISQGDYTVWKDFYPDGQPKYSRTYKNGLPAGVWTEWYDNGQKMLELCYEDGIKQYEYRWNDKGVTQYTKIYNE